MGILGRKLKRNKGSDWLSGCVPKNRPKKYRVPLSGRKREKFGNCIRYGIIFAVWCLLICIAIRVDKVYYSQSKGCFSGLVKKFVDIGDAWGVTHDFLYDTLGGYSGVLLTVVGMIVAGWLSFSDRLEKRVYGIRRKELFGRNPFGRWLVDSYMGVFTAPAWMVYALIRRYCFTAYFIMALVFVQFLVSDILLATTYSRGKDRNSLIKKISHSWKKAKAAGAVDAFDELLDRIEASIGEETDWGELSILFLACVEEAKKKGEHELYRISRNFVSKVYANRNKDKIVDLTALYIQEVDKGFEAESEERTKLVYWALLDCLYQNCSEEQIASYLDRLTDMLSLNGAFRGARASLSIDWIEEIFAMVAVQTEYWLQKNNSRLRCFGENFGKIIQMSEVVYADEKRSEMLLEFIGIRQYALKEMDRTMHQCFGRLRGRCLKEEGPRQLDSLLWGIWEWQQ